MSGLIDGHEVDDEGNLIHVDFDPVIPTGLCRICAQNQSD